MSGTQKVNKLSRKSKKKPTESLKLDDSLADFSSVDPSEKKSQKVEKKSDIFTCTQTQSIKPTCDQSEKGFSNNALEAKPSNRGEHFSPLKPHDRGKYSSESNPPDNVNVTTSDNQDPKLVERTGHSEDCVATAENHQKFKKESVLNKFKAVPKIADLKQLPNAASVSEVAGDYEVEDTVHVLADCPMCGKQFKSGLAVQRNAHLKSCGTKLGMKADKLVELRRLEERQAEERAALGLPIIPKTQTVDKPPKKVQRKPKPTKKDGADPDLELALALSISAATGENHVRENPADQLVAGNNVVEVGVRSQVVDGEAQLRANCGTEVGSKLNEAQPKSSQNRRDSMWLPQAPAPQKRRGKKKLVGKTILQTRSEAERERLVGEKVAAILYPEAEYNPQMDRIKRSTLPGRKCNERLVKFEDPENLFWSIASLPKTVKNGQFLADKLENFISVKQFGDCSEKKCDETVEAKMADVTTVKSDCNERILEEIKKSVQPSLKKLCDDWINLFKSRKRTDLKILCREEKIVLCHRLVLEVRCTKILKDTVKEICDEGEEEIVIWSSFDEKVVLVFVEFLYGGVLDLSVIETVQELVQLRQMAEINEVREIIDILKEVRVEEVDENDVTGGFCEEEVDKDPASATQNLNALLDCLDNFENDEVEEAKEEDVKEIVEEEEEEDWDEVCQFMTQKVKQSVDTSHHEEVEEDLDLKLSDSNDSIFEDEQNDVMETSERKSPNQNSNESPKAPKATISRASSPDMFGSDDDDDDIIETEWNVSQNTPIRSKSEGNSSKRKLDLSDDCGEESLKKRQTISPLLPSSHLHQVCSPSCPPSSIPPISPVRLDFSDNSNELPTPTKYRISPKTKDISRFSMKPDDHRVVDGDNDEEEGVIDLTQTTPTPPNILPSKSDDLVKSSSSPKSGRSSVVNSPISMQSSPMNFLVNSQSKSPKPLISSPKSFSSPSKSISSPVKSPSTSSPSKYLSSPVKSKLYNTVDLITKAVEQLSDANVNDDQTERCLKSLVEMEVTVPMMLETGVGKLVRKLRDREGRIGRLAGRLVARWKKLVFAYEGPEVAKNGNMEEAGLNTQKHNQTTTKATSNEDEVRRQSPCKAASNDEEVIGDDREVMNGTHDHDEGTSDADMNGDVWENEANDICDINGLNDDIANFEVEDSAYWRPQSQPTPTSPQPHSTPESIKSSAEKCTPHRSVESVKNSAKQLLTPQNRPKSPTPLRIQSLKNSAKKAANGFMTPENVRNQQFPAKSSGFMTPENVRNRQLPDATPMADYDMMLTPELRDELHRFGLKAVPRRKAVQLLRFIYDKTHPFVDKENSSPYVEAKNLKRANSPKPNSISKSKMKTSAKKVRIAHKPSTSKSSLNVETDKSANCSSKSTNYSSKSSKSAKGSSKALERLDDEEAEEDEDLNLSQGSTCSNESQGYDVPEESMMDMEEEEEDDDDVTPSQILTEGNLQTQLRSFIHSKPDLHHSILIFEPIWLKEFFSMVKQAGIKCKLPQVMDFLDQECITFRTESNRNNRQKKSSPKKKKSSPVKQKSPKKGGGRKMKDSVK